MSVSASGLQLSDLTTTICSLFRISFRKLKDLDETERQRQDELDVKTLRILRAIVHNEIVNIDPELYEGDPPGYRRRCINKVQPLQNKLQSFGNAMSRVSGYQCLESCVVWVSVSGVMCGVGVSVWSHVWCGYQCLESRVVWVSVSGVTCGVGVSVWSHVWCGCQCLESRVVWVSVSGVTCGVGVSVWSHVWCGCQCLESCVVWVSVSGVVCGVGISVWSRVWCGYQCLESRVVWVSVSGVTCGVGISVWS